MARKTQQQILDELLTRFEPEIAKAFRAAIDDLRTSADLARVIAALSAGDVNTAIQAMHLDPAAFGPVVEAIRQTYAAGGAAAATTIPALKDAAAAAMVIRFDVRNPRAEAWLSQRSADLVTRIVEDQRATLRTALTAGMARGAHPRTVAMDVVGRINRVTGKREGGVIGLTAPQEEFARSAAEELASADPTALRAYLGRARRDKRFDRSVSKALTSGKPIPADVASKAVTAYRNRLLALRGQMIARTEALTSLHAAKHESYLQAVERGGVSSGAIRRTWRDAGDLRVRHTHTVLDGETVGLLEPFTSPSGAQLLYPGDTSLGASAAEVIGCRCDVEYRIDFLGSLG